MSDGHPPAGPAGEDGRSEAAPHAQGWLLRMLRRLAFAAMRPEFERFEAEAAVGHAAIARQKVARDELQRELDAMRAAIDDVRGAYLATRGEFEEVRDVRVPALAAGLEAESHAVSAIQREVEAVRDQRLPQQERLLEQLRAANHTVQVLAEELRDQRLPSLSARTDALVQRLHEDLTELTGLVERLAQGEPLHVEVGPAVEERIPAAVTAASAHFVDAFRGEREEILGRAADHLELLRVSAPVLDLGCGRGELLEALRGAGVEARGVDSDPAMVARCRRLGLAVECVDALAALRAAPAASLGAVTAIHVVEHMPAAGWMALVDAAAAALRPGGLLLLESPNPESLRVSADLFWLDPTHRAPVHPEALGFIAGALGLEVVETRRVRPFPPEQALADPSQPEAVRALATRLDQWLSGPRDYLLVARKP